ncbi:hypothetical protein AVEN_171530-1 [Araneus ventricosus]|uniref:Uncharacterized protein n=1 Tax=Araneus ventricosus TaxID=182803 RepID=A0A4Y2MCB4_ARAVE|nr:hypothetical protein AVEN_171530-1 [Araneus ventricosus]
MKAAVISWQSRLRVRRVAGSPPDFLGRSAVSPVLWIIVCRGLVSQPNIKLIVFTRNLRSQQLLPKEKRPLPNDKCPQQRNRQFPASTPDNFTRGLAGPMIHFLSLPQVDGGGEGPGSVFLAAGKLSSAGVGPTADAARGDI